MNCYINADVSFPMRDQAVFPRFPCQQLGTLSDITCLLILIWNINAKILKVLGICKSMNWKISGLFFGFLSEIWIAIHKCRCQFSDEGSSSISMVSLSTTRDIIRHNLPNDFNQDFDLKHKCQDLKSSWHLWIDELKDKWNNSVKFSIYRCFFLCRWSISEGRNGTKTGTCGNNGRKP